MLTAVSNASSRSSMQIMLVTTMTLSFTKSPTGSAVATASLYEAMSGAILLGVPWVKQKAPRPSEPALANVGGLPAATHIGGGGGAEGVGETSPGGVREEVAPFSYFPSLPIFWGSPTPPSPLFPPS